MNGWQVFGLLALLAVIGYTLIVLGVSVYEFRAYLKETKEMKRPEPVNAIAENVNWRHERRVADRAKWDTDFYELEHGPLPEGVRRVPGGGYASGGYVYRPAAQLRTGPPGTGRRKA